MLVVLFHADNWSFSSLCISSVLCMCSLLGPVCPCQSTESAWHLLSGYDDRHICGTALLCFVWVKKWARYYPPQRRSWCKHICVLMDSDGPVAVCACVQTLFLHGGVQMCCTLHVCFICLFFLLYFVDWDWKAVIWRICAELSTVSGCVCTCVVTFSCYYFCVCLWWVIAHRTYGRLYMHVSGVKFVSARPDTDVCVCVEAFVLLPFIFLSGWLNSHMPVVWVCVLSVCVGSGSMCVRVLAEVSLGWPWMESWRRAEVKEEICRNDTHHFPHYYFFFFCFYCSVLRCLFLLSLAFSVFFFPHLHALCSVSTSPLSCFIKTVSTLHSQTLNRIVLQLDKIVFVSQNLFQL